MANVDDHPDGPGVYVLDDDDGATMVHSYEDGDYTLADVSELFNIGSFEVTGDGENPVLVMYSAELRDLKAAADAYSFDYEPEFIQMCLDMFEAGGSLPPGEKFRFIGNF